MWHVAAVVLHGGGVGNSSQGLGLDHPQRALGVACRMPRALRWDVLWGFSRRSFSMRGWEGLDHRGLLGGVKEGLKVGQGSSCDEHCSERRRRSGVYMGLREKCTWHDAPSYKAYHCTKVLVTDDWELMPWLGLWGRCCARVVGVGWSAFFRCGRVLRKAAEASKGWECGVCARSEECTVLLLCVGMGVLELSGGGVHAWCSMLAMVLGDGRHLL